jgi:hypothetical protein
MSSGARVRCGRDTDMKLVTSIISASASIPERAVGLPRFAQALFFWRASRESPLVTLTDPSILDSSAMFECQRSTSVNGYRRRCPLSRLRGIR